MSSSARRILIGFYGRCTERIRAIQNGENSSLQWNSRIGLRRTNDAHPMLTDKHVEKFQALYRARYKKEISRAAAYDELVALVRFVELVYCQEAEWQEIAPDKGELDNQ